MQSLVNLHCPRFGRQAIQTSPDPVHGCVDARPDPFPLHLAEVQPERVDEVRALARVLQAYCDVIEDLFQPATAGEHAIAGSQFQARGPFRSAVACRP